MTFPPIDWKPKIRDRLDSYRRDELMRQLVQSNGILCHWCGCRTAANNSVDGRQMLDCRTLDHKIPRASGGPDTLENTVVACFECNQRRGKEDQFFIELERLARRSPNRLFGSYVIEGEAM